MKNLLVYYTLYVISDVCTYIERQQVERTNIDQTVILHPVFKTFIF